MSLLGVKGKIILITGAARGIGLHLANQLDIAGAQVIRADLSFDDIKTKNHSYWIGDLTNERSVDELLKMIRKEYGRLDVLINNAGVTLPSETKPYPKNNWEKTMKVNLEVPFNLSSKSIELLEKSNNPSVINIASLNASLAFPNNPAYIASKAAIVGLTRSMALDYGNIGIRFNSISPGYIKTDMTGESWTNLSKRKSRQNRTTLGRWGTPEDLVGITVLLCSDHSAYITGQDFLIDGGWSIKGL